MKKLSVLLLVQLLVFGTACYGAVSEDMSVYVRKDVFDVYMQGLNARIDDLRSSMYMYVGMLLLGIIVVLPTISQSHADHTPSLTIDDVKRLIEENNMKLSGKSAGVMSSETETPVKYSTD